MKFHIRAFAICINVILFLMLLVGLGYKLLGFDYEEMGGEFWVFVFLLAWAIHAGIDKHKEKN